MRFQRKNEIPHLDGFRGLLAVWLFWFHVNLFDQNALSSHPELVNFIKGGPMGVDGFFAMSGFILVHVYHQSFDSYESKFDLLKTYLKFLYFRVARIWPLHLMMSALWIKPYIFEWRCTKEEFFMEVTFTTPIYQPDRWVGMCNPPSWSIINEFYAYLSFPFLYFFLTKLNKNNSVIKNILMIGFVLGVLLLGKGYWHYHLYHEWKFDHLAYFDINMTIFEFFVGMAFYRIYEKYNRKHWTNDLIVLSLSVLIVYINVNYNYMDYYQKYSYIILVFPFFLVKMNSFMAYILSSDVFKFLGDISFSLYLSHVFWIAYFAAKINAQGNILFPWLELAFVMIQSYLLYIFYETPMRNLFRKIWEFVARNYKKRQYSLPQKLENELEDITLPIKMKNLDPIFGYCTKSQFHEIVERMTLLRKKMYFLTTQKNEKNYNIEVFFPMKEIEEICRKLPKTQNELCSITENNKNFIDISEKYGSWIIEEVNMFIRINEIKKEEFAVYNENQEMMKKKIDENFAAQQIVFEVSDEAGNNENLTTKIIIP